MMKFCELHEIPVKLQTGVCSVHVFNGFEFVFVFLFVILDLKFKRWSSWVGWDDEVWSVVRRRVRRVRKKW